MELAIPGVALGLFYVVSNQKKNNEENFENQTKLPNTNVPNRNFPNIHERNSEQPIESIELDQTNKTTVNNKYDGSAGAYTDKYFNQTDNTEGNDNAQYYSLSGNTVSREYFRHDNMTPYFGSNVTTANPNTSYNEGILDNYTGSGSQHIEKDAQAPLFTPSENLQWANGAPNSNEFFRSRVNPSMKMANVKPFKSEMVAPGLGLGASNEGSDGFNSGMMSREQWMPKNVDELRTDNHQKTGGLSALGHEGPAMSHTPIISNRDNMGVMEKHRPERAFETGPDRLFTTTGLEKKQPFRAIHVDRHVNRPETTTDYIGVAGNQNESSYVKGEYMPTHNQQLGTYPLAVANANGRNGATEHDYEAKAKKAYPNNRTANKQDSYFGVVGSGLGAAVAPLLDVLRPSRKENTIGTLRPYQNAGKTVSETYIFNPNDKLPTTMRETTEQSKFHMNVNRNQLGGAYQVTETQVADTNRYDTGDHFYAGNAGAAAGTREQTSYQANYNQRNNDIKASTIDGYMVKGNMKMLNHDMNVREKERDTMLHNKREVAGGMAYNTPDSFNIGRVAGQEGKLLSTINEERNKPDMNNMLKSNPYVVDYKNAL